MRPLNNIIRDLNHDISVLTSNYEDRKSVFLGGTDLLPESFIAVQYIVDLLLQYRKVLLIATNMSEQKIITSTEYDFFLSQLTSLDQTFPYDHIEKTEGTLHAEDLYQVSSKVSDTVISTTVDLKNFFNLADHHHKKCIYIAEKILNGEPISPNDKAFFTPTIDLKTAITKLQSEFKEQLEEYNHFSQKLYDEFSISNYFDIINRVMHLLDIKRCLTSANKMANKQKITSAEYTLFSNIIYHYTWSKYPYDDIEQKEELFSLKNLCTVASDIPDTDDTEKFITITNKIVNATAISPNDLNYIGTVIFAKNMLEKMQKAVKGSTEYLDTKITNSHSPKMFSNDKESLSSLLNQSLKELTAKFQSKYVSDEKIFKNITDDDMKKLTDILAVNVKHTDDTVKQEWQMLASKFEELHTLQQKINLLMHSDKFSDTHDISLQSTKEYKK